MGDAIIDPAGSWEPSTAEQYIDQQIGIEASTRLAQDTYLQSQIPLADEEDLTKSGSYLKFKDRTYNSVSPNGMGRVILRNNIVNGVNTLTQTMISQSNTIYVIQYDFTLGEDITVPDNCVLEFEGGSISGEKSINGNGCTISGNPDIRCSITNIGNGTTLLRWFTNVQDKNTAFVRAATCAGTSNDTLNAALDGENIPVNITGQINLGETQRCDLLNLDINFTATADGQSMLLCDSSVAYGGQFGNIRHCKFTMINPSSYRNVHCIHFRRWYNTSRGSFNDIQVIDFSGYMFICESYLQEQSFERFKGINVGGFISFNKEFGTANAFGDYSAGSSNILSFIQCGIDNGININNSITDIVDLTKSIDVSFESCVWQGDGKQKDINLINITSFSSFYNPVIKISNSWCEFTNTSSNLAIVLNSDKVSIDVSAYLCKKLYVNGKCCNITYHTTGGIQINSDLFVIAQDCYPRINFRGFSSAAYSNNSSLIELRKKANVTVDVQESTTSTLASRPIYMQEGCKIDILNELYLSQVKSANAYRLSKRYENNIPIYEVMYTWNAYATGDGFRKQLPICTLDIAQRYANVPFIYRILYRLTPAVEVTATNVADIKDVIQDERSILIATGTSNAFVIDQSLNREDNPWREKLIMNPTMPSNISNVTRTFNRDTGSAPWSEKTPVYADIAVIECYCGFVSYTPEIIIDPSDNTKLIKVNKGISKFGETSGRPAAHEPGTMFFDTTLGKPIYWTGSAWVDATGTPV